MPYNFITGQKYNFDFNAIYNSLMQNPIFEKQKSYAQKWMKIFQQLDFYDTNIVNISDIISHIKMGEVYQYKFFLEDETFFLHFNIEERKHNVLLELQPYPSQQLPLSQFGTKRGYIQYTNEPQPSHDINYKNSPIILCEFPIEDTRFIVIDGNHRITSLINKGEKTVEAVGCHPMNRKSFISNVDWAMYLFKLETYQICCHVDQGEDIESLIKGSNAYNTFRSI